MCYLAATTIVYSLGQSIRHLLLLQHYGHNIKSNQDIINSFMCMFYYRPIMLLETIVNPFIYEDTILKLFGRKYNALYGEGFTP